ncbi:MAG: FG-GAP-like repeat-containing protein, partial [Nannocystaceae bacterium]|nr:FG-GAP-like repeat-containing protein [Nannocystaceae bacterium]
MLVAIGWLVVGTACNPLRAEGDGGGTTTASSASTTITSSTSGAAGSGESVDVGVPVVDVGPSRPLQPPFELPPGCGDGVVVPGKYDCFVPVMIHWPGLYEGPVGEGHDVDGDGREEMVYSPTPARLLSYDPDEGFALGPGQPAPLYSHENFSWRWDWDGDGKKELTHFPTGADGRVVVNATIGKDDPGAWVEVHRWDEPLAVYGKAVPIDVDGDGQLEIVAARALMPRWEHSPVEITLRRRVGDQWVFSGPTFPFGGCGDLAFHAFGDVDGDGDEDLVIADNTFVCDPYPPHYDPSWHVVGVFLVDAAVGELQLAG